MSLLNDALEDLERRAPAPKPDASVVATGRVSVPRARKRAIWRVGSTVGCAFAGLAVLGLLNLSASSPILRSSISPSLPAVSSATPPARFAPSSQILPEPVAEARRAAVPAAPPKPRAVQSQPTHSVPVQPVPKTLAPLRRVAVAAVSPTSPTPTVRPTLAGPDLSSPGMRQVSAPARGGAGDFVDEQPEPSPLVELDARARTLLERGQPAAAVELWVAASAEPGAGHKVQRNAVAQLMKRGAIREARILVRHVRSQGRVPSEWAGLEAQLVLESGDPSGALQILLAIDADQPRDANTFGLEAALWSQHARPDKAAEAYRRAIAMQPDHSQWWLGLAIASDSAGRTLGARAAYRRVLRSRDLEDAPRAYAQRRLTELQQRALPTGRTDRGQP